MVTSTLHSLARGLGRRSYLLAVASVLACSAFAAAAASSLLEAEALSPASVSPHVALRAATAAPPVKPPLDGGDLVARNMFCSTCEPPSAAGGTGADARFAGKPAILIATAIGVDPRATVRVPETEVQGDWGLGDRIPGVGTIDRIGPVSIDVIDGAGVHATLRLLELSADPTSLAVISHHVVPS